MPTSYGCFHSKLAGLVLPSDSRLPALVQLTCLQGIVWVQGCQSALVAQLANTHAPGSYHRASELQPLSMHFELTCRKRSVWVSTWCKGPPLGLAAALRSSSAALLWHHDCSWHLAPPRPSAATM